MRIGCVAALSLLMTTCGAPASSSSPPNRATTSASPSASTTSPDPTLEAIDQIVRTRFYSEAVLEKSQWSRLVANSRRGLGAERGEAGRTRALQQLLAALRTSHTEYIPRSEPKYWELASIFEEVFAEVPAQCPDKDKTLPPLPVTWQDIGVLWKQVDSRWFVSGVFDDAPAQKTGLLLGDEVVAADGKPFAPVASFAKKENAPVELTVRRAANGPTIKLSVVPRTSHPHGAFQDALRASAHIIEANGDRIAYVHVWSWTGQTMHQELKSAIAKLNEKKPSGYILDIRDGWGGAAPDYLDIFQKDVPVLVSKNRAGQEFRMDSKIRVPAVLLINGGSRSGKETIAYGVKKHGLAKLVGEPTAGAMLPGSPFCLPDGGLLYVASATNTVDGESLEGRGITPDVRVPFDVRYAAGRDPQLEAAIQALRSK